MKKGLKIALLMLMMVGSIRITTSTVAFGATRYVTREEFVTMVMKELNFTVEETDTGHPYIEAAIRAGIISNSTFGAEYEKILTKSDAAVILSNADEYLYGRTVSEDMINMIIEKRISDIDKVSKGRQPFVAKAYALGFLKGSSNGEYSTDRSMKAWQKVSSSTADSFVEMISNKGKRSQISPDGQLIRTTKLPSNAEMYPYILASYPNEYYDWEFDFMKWMVYVESEDDPNVLHHVPQYTTKKFQEERYDRWAEPANIRKLGHGQEVFNLGNHYARIEEVIDVGLELWVEKTKLYLRTAFNIDYRTIEEDEDWYNTILSLDSEYKNKHTQERTEKYIAEYIKAVVANKTIIECDKVAVDGSTLYVSEGNIYMRCYVHYRIVSAKNVSQVRISPLAFTTYTYPTYENVKLGKWRNGYFDVSLDPAYGNFGIDELIISDYSYHNKVVQGN